MVIIVQQNKIVLIGGPPGLCRGDVIEVANPIALDTNVKIEHASGYEHFEPSGEIRVVNGETVPVYSWCQRTKIAE
jgi:hypothetical protein